MKPLLTLTLVAATAVTLFAQGSATPAGTPTPLPPGPLFKPFPSQIRWTITRKGAQAGPQTPAPAVSGPATPGANPAAGQPLETQNANQIDLQIVGEKVGDVSHVITIYPNGNKHEVWKKGSLQALLSSGGTEPIISRAAEEFTEEMDWISASNFAGIQKVSGRDCMVFRDKILPQMYRNNPDLLKPATPKSAQALAEEARIQKVLGGEETPTVNPESLRMTAVACIDLESRVPMGLQMGQVVTTYKYEALPSGYALALPPEIASAMQANAQQMQATTLRPVRP